MKIRGDDPPAEFIHDITHLVRALEKEGLAETQIGPDGQLAFRTTRKFTPEAFKRVSKAVEAELDALDTAGGLH